MIVDSPQPWSCGTFFFFSEHGGLSKCLILVNADLF